MACSLIRTQNTAGCLQFGRLSCYIVKLVRSAGILLPEMVTRAHADVSMRAIWAFIIEELVGLPLLCGVGLTVFLSPHIRRRAAWINVYLACLSLSSGG
jgi:hypothetical protein